MRHHWGENFLCVINTCSGEITKDRARSHHSADWLHRSVEQGVSLLLPMNKLQENYQTGKNCVLGTRVASSVKTVGICGLKKPQPVRLTGSRANDSAGFEIVKTPGVVRETACIRREPD